MQLELGSNTTESTTDAERPPDSGAVPRVVAFLGHTLVGRGPLDEVAVALAARTGGDASVMVQVFHADTSEIIDLDLRGELDAVRQRALDVGLYNFTRAKSGQGSPEGHRGPGRPRLGVVAREVTLLPRHWEWLNEQPGGASAALRRLVDQARKANAGRDRLRRAQEAAYRFMSAMAGNEPGFEGACRALYAPKPRVFAALVDQWPHDVAAHARQLAAEVFAAADALPPTEDTNEEGS